MGKFEDLTGRKYGILLVLGRTDDYVSPSGKHTTRWLCKCECGNEISTRGSNLKNGRTKSCGCYKAELNKMSPKHITHRLRNTRLYNIWRDMKLRCYNPNNGNYYRYGARGINICDDWLKDFKVFYDWAMSNGYRDHLTIERKDTNGNYCPENCKWADQKEQQNNRCNNKIITDKSETHTLSEWSEITGINRGTIYSRLNRGWSVERALYTPVKK